MSKVMLIRNHFHHLICPFLLLVMYACQMNSGSTTGVKELPKYLQVEIMDSIGATHTLQEFTGRLVLIDFWASWCSPCLEDMPFWKEKIKKFEQEIFFVSISLDNDHDYWKQFATQNQITHNSFWVGRSENELVALTYVKMEEQPNIIGLPLYVLLSTDGSILIDKLPHPQDPRFDELIMSKLNNQK